MSFFSEFVDVKFLIDLQTTKSLTNFEYISMGIKIIVFHLDCYDCPKCQELHQKLNKMNGIFEANGYILLLYYCRSDQEIFNTFRSEFNNTIDYFLVEGLQEEFPEVSECNSHLIEIHENYIANSFNHFQITTEFSKILKDLNIEEVSEELDELKIVISPASSPVENSPQISTQNKFRSSFDLKIGKIKKFTDQLMSPRGRKSPRSPDSIESFEQINEEDYQFSKEFQKNPKIILENSYIKDSLQIGFKVILFHMDNLKCQNCLEFHEILNLNSDFYHLK